MILNMISTTVMLRPGYVYGTLTANVEVNVEPKKFQAPRSRRRLGIFLDRVGPKGLRS